MHNCNSSLRLHRPALICFWLIASIPASANPPQEIFASAAPSVVVIEVRGHGGELKSTGSGVVIAKGEVITNCHVAEIGKTLIVRQGKASYPARLHYADQERDLCQLSVANFNASSVPLGDINDLQPGARVVAIGAPRGLELSISEGLVAALREFGAGTKIIQTTAAISPGSSGGGLFDDSGRLVGITTFYFDNGQNLNFAMPVNWIAELPKRSVVQEKLKTSSVEWLSGAAQLEKKQDWQGLLAYSQRWSKTELQSGVAWLGLGNAYSNLKQYSQAVGAYREALRRDPKYASAWMNLGNAYSDLKQYSQAIDAYRESLRLDPTDAKAWNNLGVAYGNHTQYSQAIEAYREALRLDPKYASAWNNLGNRYSHLKQYSQANDAYREALRLDPKYASAWNSLGKDYGYLS